MKVKRATGSWVPGGGRLRPASGPAAPGTVDNASLPKCHSPMHQASCIHGMRNLGSSQAF
eukprot:11568053-Prorocentrum_lima.AAC.1